MTVGRSSYWETVYPFQGLQIGESVEVTGIEGNVRSAASMWGTRYGIWLQVNKIDDGFMKVTRIAEPKNIKRKDGLREILLDMTQLLITIRNDVEELKERTL